MTAVGRLRLVAIAEGVSFLALLLVAMPLKYVAGNPLPVKVLGWVHGALFLGYMAALADANAKHNWPLRRVLALFLAAVLPGAPFFLEGWLRRQAAGERDASAGVPGRAV